MPVTEVENGDDGKGYPDYVAADGANTRVATNMREDIDAELRELIEGSGGDKGYQVRVFRTNPKKWEGVSIEGHIGTFEEWLEEDDLKREFGGGTYQLRVFRPNAKGSWQYFRAVTVKIAGKPKGEGIEEEKHAPIDYGPMEDNSLGAQAMDTMKQLVEDARSSKGGMDMPAMMAMFGTMMEPIKAQMQASQAQLIEAQRVAAEKEARIMELITHKPDTSEKDSLLDKMFSTETSRSEHLRQMHESEMRQMRENAKEEIKRIEDRHREELRSRESQQEREISNITRANDQMITTLKMSYDSIINGLKSDIARIERDLSKSDTELVTLRAVKNKTVIETASEFAAMKEAIETISGGGKDDDDDRKWYEKLAGQVLDNPESVGQVFSMVTGQNPAAQQQQQQQQQQHQLPPQQQQQQQLTLEDIPLGQPFRAEDGQVYVRVPPDGSVVPLAQAQAMADAAEAKKNGGLKKPDADDVKIAIRFMESAFTAGTGSADFALSARSMIPNDIIKYMETVGVDTFLNEVAVLEQGSPLRNQAGRTYMREVAKFLLEGVTG